ncbi:ABC transporter ATP-binding protein [Microbacterium deminutum]|uniref:ABC transporter domain-containing protein n=1 Tax=Microbacterium deminutum TaxID=344164 RepID=A0ABN2QRZ8_9MICO
MPEGLALEFSGVTKRFGAITAVSDFSARIEPGRVTGFLGPNGAGKTTSLRILLGLVRATEGSATIGGVPYAQLDRPLQTVGAVLEASSFHPGRTAANHLVVYAQAAGIPRTRVDDVLGLVGLADAAGRKVGGFSLGMRQRLGLAYALLGDPGILVLDEPANGLDPEGIKWMRGLLRQLAREGRTVLTSSHLLAEVQQTVDSLLIISHGRLVFEGGLDELTDPSEYATVVDSPDRNALIAALTDADVPFEVLRSGLTVRGLEPADVGALAASAGVALSSLHRRGPALEEVFLDLVNGTRVHPGPVGAAEAVITGADAAPEEQADAGAGADEQMDAAPEAESPPAAHPAFIVASTGVIDVGSSEAEPRTEAFIPPEAEEAPGPDAEETTVAAEDATGDAEDGTVGAEDARGDPDEAVDDPDLVGSDDEPLDEVASAVSPESDRPWEEYVKTDSDLEADAFFASFDASQAAGAAPPEAVPVREAESHDERDPEPELDPEPALSDLSSEWVEEEQRHGRDHGGEQR